MLSSHFVRFSSPLALAGALIGVTVISSGACTTADPRPGLGTHDFRTSAGSGVATGGTTGGGNAPGSGGLFGEGGAGGEGPGPGPISACGDAPEGAASFSKKALLRAAGECSAWSTCLFVELATELRDDVNDYVDDPTPESLDRARRSWAFAMRAWAGVVPFEFGPITTITSDPGHGRSLMSFVHSWPTPNRCEVEKQVSTRYYEEEGFQRIPPGGRGLYALEYLLFYPGSDTVCSASSTAAKKWAELDPGELDQAKRDYARAVVEDVLTHAHELENVWAEDGENFLDMLVNAEGYEGEQGALTIVAWSLLYLYEDVRDKKIAPRAGMVGTFLNPETPFADIERETVLSNVAAFRRLYAGCNEGKGLGYDDWLTAVDGTTLRDDLFAALDAIEASALALPAYGQATEAQMADFYADLKVLSDLLKGSFFGSASLLNLDLPEGAASDTD